MTAIRPVSASLAPEARFRAVFATHYPAVYGYAARRVGRDEASDAASETFTVAWRKVSSIPEEPDTLPWLYGVARRVVANHQRSHRRRERLGAKTAAQPLRAAPPADAGAGVLAALDGVSADDREILMLAAWEGLGPADIGTVLGCSRNAAAIRLHRARKRLQSAIDETGGDA
jgi:RNA polymerase sigma-70 factor (ECF subfamily)